MQSSERQHKPITVLNSSSRTVEIAKFGPSFVLMVLTLEPSLPVHLPGALFQVL
jgi:hypothetical protein